MDNIKTVNNLRQILADEIKKLRNKETTAANVNAITNATGKIFSSIRKELKKIKRSQKPKAEK